MPSPDKSYRDWFCYNGSIQNLIPHHNDITTWKHSPHYWPIVWGIHRWIPSQKASNKDLLYLLRYPSKQAIMCNRPRTFRCYQRQTDSVPILTYFWHFLPLSRNLTNLYFINLQKGKTNAVWTLCVCVRCWKDKCIVCPCLYIDGLGQDCSICYCIFYRTGDTTVLHR